MLVDSASLSDVVESDKHFPLNNRLGATRIACSIASSQGFSGLSVIPVLCVLSLPL